jgi:hypothetical protein
MSTLDEFSCGPSASTHKLDVAAKLWKVPISGQPLAARVQWASLKLAGARHPGFVITSDHSENDGSNSHAEADAHCRKADDERRQPGDLSHLGPHGGTFGAKARPRPHQGPAFYARGRDAGPWELGRRDALLPRSTLPRAAWNLPYGKYLLWRTHLSAQRCNGPVRRRDAPTVGPDQCSRWPCPRGSSKGSGRYASPRFMLRRKRMRRAQPMAAL